MNTAAARSAYDATYAASGDQFAATDAYFDALDTVPVTAPVSPPTVTPTGSSVTVPDPASPEGRQAAALLAVELEAKRKTMVEGARLLLRDEHESKGLTREQVDGLSDEDVLAVAGIAPKQLTRAEQRIADDDAREADDPVAALKEKAEEQFHAEYWHLSPLRRRAEAEYLGLDYEAVVSAMDAERERKGL